MIPWTLNLDYLYLSMNLDCELYREKMCIYNVRKEWNRRLYENDGTKDDCGFSINPPPPPKKIIKVGIEHCAAG